jgi:hypothetical protein
MASIDKETTTTLIQTKLHQPQLPVDLVPRPRLIDWLGQCHGRPLTLVSAPAGYGKSTLISCWLSSVDYPTAWVSLDEHDNQLYNFLSYFLAAIQTIFPQALQETQSFLSSTPRPSVDTIARTLTNELNQIEEPFFLVLDDYHLIESQIIHDLLSALLDYPSHSFHLVLCTRMDPPLPLITLRAKNLMTEIRIQDLSVKAHLLVQGIQVQVDDRAQWPLAPGFQDFVQLGGCPADLCGGYLATAQSLSDGSDFAGRHALHIHLGQGQHQRPLAAQPFLQRLRVEATFLYLRYIKSDRCHPRANRFALVAVAVPSSFS